MKKQTIIKTSIITAIITFITTSILGTILYFALTPTLTIVFYQTEYIEEQITENYTEEYLCAYFRLNTKENHKIEVKDFSILNNGKYEQAIYVEYFNQIIKTNFETYPNQPILKVYFKVTDDITDKVIFTKYKNTEMRVGEFAKTK